MTALAHIAPPQFRDRIVDCDECNGTGRWCQDYYDRGHDCPGCDGTGEWSAVCDDCGGDGELNDAGLCRDCVSLVGLTAADLADPFLKRKEA